MRAVLPAVAVSAGLIASSGFAADTFEIADQDNSYVLDRQSVKLLPTGLRQATLLLLSKRPIKIGGQNYRVIRLVDEYDCKRKRSRSVAGTPLSDKLQPSGRALGPPPPEWTDIQPGSVGAGRLKLVCTSQVVGGAVSLGDVRPEDVARRRLARWN
jgi:hypothetical protein